MLTEGIVVALTMNYCHTRDVFPNFRLSPCNFARRIQNDSLTQLSYSLLPVLGDSLSQSSLPQTPCPGTHSLWLQQQGQGHEHLAHVPRWGTGDDPRLSLSLAQGRVEVMSLGWWVKAGNDDQWYNERKEAFWWTLTKKNLLKNTLYLFKITLGKKKV